MEGVHEKDDKDSVAQTPGTSEEHSHGSELLAAILIVLILGGAIWNFFFRGERNIEIIYERTEVTAPEFADELPQIGLLFAGGAEVVYCPTEEISENKFKCAEVKELQVSISGEMHRIWVVDRARFRKDEEGEYVRKSHLVAEDIWIDGTKVEDVEERRGAEEGYFVVLEGGGIQ